LALYPILNPVCGDQIGLYSEIPQIPAPWRLAYLHLRRSCIVHRCVDEQRHLQFHADIKEPTVRSPKATASIAGIIAPPSARFVIDGEGTI